METLQRTANRGSISTGYDIDNSLKFEADNTELIYRTNNVGTNRKTFTVSAWFKRTELGVDQQVWHGGTFGEATRIGISSYLVADDSLWVDVAGGTGNSGTQYRSFSTLKIRDTSAWYHVCVAVDTTQATEANRMKVWLNGEEVTDWAQHQIPAQDFQCAVESGIQMAWGGYRTANLVLFSGYLAECHYLDGVAKVQTDFGEYDEDSGIWKPIEYTGTYGGNGCYMKFDDSSDLGADSSGNSNDFTLQNITSADQATDTPTNNFCTWNPLWAEPRANGTISEGATQVAWGGGAWKIARSSMAVSKGRWYWEIKGANVTGDTWNNNLFGFASVEGENGQYGPTVLLGYSTGNYYYRVANSQTGEDNWGDAGGAWSSSDTFGFALDLESATKKFILYRNGSAVNGSGTDLVSAFQTEQFFTPYATSYNGDTQFLNWGGYTVNTISSAASDENGYGTFEYAPPSGYYALCSKNLAEYG
jgi:hypothetical protein